MHYSRRASYWACFFSVQKLFPPLEKRELWDEKREDELTAKLWTFTFGDPEARSVEAEAAARWTKFARWLGEQGYKAVHVLEKGSVGKGWHHHCVTPQFWPVQKIREASNRYGFGRINVKPIPASKVYYVAKYVGKDLRGEQRAARRWSCIGFKGIRCSDIVFSESARVLVENTYDGCLWDVLEWYSDGQLVHSAKLRDPVPGQPLHVKKMEMKPHWRPAIEAALLAGEKICIGEYRGCEAVIKKVDAYEGGKVVGKVSRIYVTHHVENAKGAADDFRERLPDPANREEGIDVTASIKPSASKGDIVLVAIDSVSKKYGSDATRVVNLSGVGDSVKSKG